MFKGLTKEEKSWVMFDWADSAYTMTVLTVVMAMYFAYAAEASGSENALAFWGFASGFVTLVAGFMAPILGTLSGYHGKKKTLFNFFTFLAIAATTALAIVPYTMWWLLLIVFVISGIGFNACNKVYDAFLADVSENKNMDRVSSLGFGMGYIGGAIGFILSIIALVLSMEGVIDLPIVRAYQISFLVTAIWWLVFCIPMFKNVHQKIGVPPEENYVRKSFVRIRTTLEEMGLWLVVGRWIRFWDRERRSVPVFLTKEQKGILLFLCAFFLYSDGVGSIIRMAVAFGDDIGIDQMTLLAVLLVVQFVAFPFAILYGKMAGKFGAKNVIYFGIGTYCVICMVGLLMNPNRDLEFLTILFWILAVLVGTAQGGIQALSRSYFARIIPKEKSNEYFGIYNIFGRFASIIGTTMFALVSLVTGRPHWGIGVIVVLFISAAILFKYVPDDRAFNEE